MSRVQVPRVQPERDARRDRILGTSCRLTEISRESEITAGPSGYVRFSLFLTLYGTREKGLIPTIPLKLPIESSQMKRIFMNMLQNCKSLSRSVRKERLLKLEQRVSNLQGTNKSAPGPDLQGVYVC
ncbi:hypothetical protein CBL_06187 [Carabus blaptoides fortunei]